MYPLSWIKSIFMFYLTGDITGVFFPDSYLRKGMPVRLKSEWEVLDGERCLRTFNVRRGDMVSW